MDVKTEEWRRLHNEELHDLYSASHIIRVIKTNEVGGGACVTYGDRRGAYKVLVERPERKRPLGRRRPR